MDPVWLNHEYFRTYRIASLVEDFSTDARFLEGLMVDGGIEMFLGPWQKHSALHRLVEYLADYLFHKDCDGPRLVTVERDWRDRRHLLPVDYALQRYGLQEEHEAFKPDLDLLSVDPTAVSNAAYAYLTEDLTWSDPYTRLLKRLAEEVFYVMFGNREALARLNGFLALQVRSLDWEDGGLADLFNANGDLRRTSPPAWARRAVYFREQGMCAACRTDLSPGRTPHSARRYDHVIPLAAGGLNDITNLQLLCEPCNRRKAASLLPPSREYRRWYPVH